MSDRTSGRSGRVVPLATGAVVFGPFRFDDEKAVLYRDGKEIVLPPRACRVLAALVARPGEILTKDELLEAGWTGSFVGEDSLTQAISQLRTALDDNAHDPIFIQTLPKRGYRFVADVSGRPRSASGLRVVPGVTPPALEERPPYPGLSAFTADDAEFFFGRDAEVEAIWAKLREARLLALIGPSGVGKTSFLRAGLLPALPPGWRGVACTPGTQPFLALMRCLVPALRDDDSLNYLVDAPSPELLIAAASRWRERCAGSVLVIDQFEELFTLSALDVRKRFARLIDGLANAAGVHVLLSMRDDFFFRCHDHPELDPVFKDVTPLAPLRGPALRRALVEPAAKHGFSFEDEGLVTEMLAEVAGERGALPLLAFAASGLWQHRDHRRMLLTREAYQDIGGVAGALAQNAEATLDAIGRDKMPIVRELFRNLTSADRTRRGCRRDELLSVFSGPDQAEDVLASLIDARLLTAYERSDMDEARVSASVTGGEANDRPAGAGPRIEVAHESLLTAWPRLLRWQIQEEGDAKMRDELRQAAQLWHEHDRSSDYLWTGSALREYQVWRERYPGGLTELETRFVDAMVACHEAGARRRRVARGALLAVATAAALALGALWMQSAARARRALAAELIGYGVAELQDYPTGALAYARASLAIADSLEARRLALEALWSGPIARVLPISQLAIDLGIPPEDAVEFGRVAGTPEGTWLAAANSVGGHIILIDRRDGSASLLPQQRRTAGYRSVGFVGEDHVVTGAYLGGRDPDLVVVSVPDGREVRRLSLREPFFWVIDDTLYVVDVTDDPGVDRYSSWKLPGGAERSLGDFPSANGISIDHAHGAAVLVDGTRIRWMPFSGSDDGGESTLGDLPDALDVQVAADGSFVAVIEGHGSDRVHIWPLGGSTEPRRTLALPPGNQLFIDAAGSWLGRNSPQSKASYVRPLEGPPDAAPIALRYGGTIADLEGEIAFLGAPPWVAVAHSRRISMFPLQSRAVQVLDAAPAVIIEDIEFTPDSRNLVTCAMRGGPRVSGGIATTLWPLRAAGTKRELPRPNLCYGMTIAPQGDEIAVANPSGRLSFWSTEDGSVRTPQPVRRSGLWFFAKPSFSPDGHRVATVSSAPLDASLNVFQITDRYSGEDRLIPLGDVPGDYVERGFVHFVDDVSLIASGTTGVWRWRLDDETSEQLIATDNALSDLCPDRRSLLVAAWSRADLDGADDLLVLDLETRVRHPITTHGTALTAVRCAAMGDVVVTGDENGIVRVGTASGEEPHLLMGHRERISGLAVSPDNRWVAASAGTEIRIWPMPDVNKTPFHLLRYDKLMERLSAATNLRVVEDRTSPTGWRLEVGSFPGWKDYPKW